MSIDIRDHGGAYGNRGSAVKGRHLVTAARFDEIVPWNYNSYFFQYGDYLLAIDGSTSVTLTVYKLSHDLKTYTRLGASSLASVTKPSLTGFRVLEVLVSVDFDNIYVNMQGYNGSSYEYYTLKINLTDFSRTDIGAPTTDAYQSMFSLIYADKNYLYSISQRHVTKFKVSDMSIIQQGTSSFGPPYSWGDYPDYANERTRFYNSNNNKVYYLDNSSGSTYYVYDLINLTFSQVKVHPTGDLRLNGLRGFYGNDRYLIYLPYDAYSPITYYFAKASAVDGSIITLSYNMSVLSNPKGFRLGTYWHQVLFFDQKENLLWIATSDIISGSSTYYYPDYYLVAINPDTLEVVDMLYMGEDGTQNTFSILTSDQLSGLYLDAYYIHKRRQLLDMESKVLRIIEK
jgi:hypothetical protein